MTEMRLCVLMHLDEMKLGTSSMVALFLVSVASHIPSRTDEVSPPRAEKHF